MAVYLRNLNVKDNPTEAKIMSKGTKRETEVEKKGKTITMKRVTLPGMIDFMSAFDRHEYDMIYLLLSFMR